MSRLAVIASAVAALALAGCGQADLAQAGRNAAWAAFEASNPEMAKGLRAAQTLKQAAATCGWADVDATALAQVGVAGIEDPTVRAAATSLLKDLLAADPPASAAQPGAPSDCAPETRKALEAQIAAIGRGGGDGG